MNSVGQFMATFRRAERISRTAGMAHITDPFGAQTVELRQLLSNATMQLPAPMTQFSDIAAMRSKR